MGRVYIKKTTEGEFIEVTKKDDLHVTPFDVMNILHDMNLL